MKVTIVASTRQVRAVAALGVGLSDAGHEAVAAGEASPGMYDIESIAEAAGGSDVVVGLGSAGAWAVSAAELVGAAGAVAAVEPPLPTREFAPAWKLRPPEKLNRVVGSMVDVMGWVRDSREVNQARRAMGLAPMGNPFHELPVLGAWSPTLVPTPADWDAGRVMVTGEWWLADEQGWTPDTKLEAFLAVGDRPIYVGLGGTAGSLAEYALGAILEAWADTYRILLDAGSLTLADDLPENVHRIESVPDDWLFSRCGALVFECDATRAHAAARSGIPSIPVPFNPSQRFWGERLYGVGAATKPVDPRSGWEAYKAALRETVPAREPAAAIAAQMAGEDGVATAVAAIQDLVGSGH
jgi:sterol 3beta-glucosyltransferase